MQPLGGQDVRPLPPRERRSPNQGLVFLRPARWLRALLALALMACGSDSLGPTLNHRNAATPSFQKLPSGWLDDFTTFDATAWLPRNAGILYLNAWNDPALAFARDGYLNIRVEERDGAYYTTQLKHSDLIKRGTVTARVRCPNTVGWWAAVWLQVDNTFLNGGLEVDLWECHRLMGDYALHAVHEYDTVGHIGFVAHSVPAKWDEWHVVSVTLEPNKPVRFTMDSVETVSPYVWPSNPVPVRVLVSGHVGSWAGQPDPAAWPDSALIDWISYTTK